MPNYQIDRIDQKILSFLVKNARMPFLEIARECNVSGAAIHQRVKRLEANGVITGSRLLVKPQALGLNVCAFVSVSLSEANKYPEVIESFKKIFWPVDVMNVLQDSLPWLREIKQIPGSYLTGRNLNNAFYQVLENATDRPIDVITEYNETLNEEIAKKRSEFGMD